MAYNPPPPYGGAPVYHPPPGPGAYPPAGQGGYGPPPPGGYGGPPVPPGAYPPGPPGIAVPPPIMNPPTPYMHALPTPAQDGLMIVVQGSLSESANRFHINMSCGGAYGETVPVALHVNPRFEGTNQVVRNSFLGGVWGQEERHGAFPVVKPAEFECIILFTRESFKVAFNGSHFCEFKHRVPMQQVTHVVIEGDVTIRCLRFQPPAQMAPGPPGAPGFAPPYQPGLAVCPPGPPGQPFPTVCPPRPPPMCAPPPPGPPTTQSMKVPYEQSIPGGLFEGRAIHITGKPSKPDKFAINLSYHNSHKRDIAFHFNPRFTEGVVVRNTMAGYTWGKEERFQSSFPFVVGQEFDVVIFVMKDRFKVHVNGQPYTEYTHRLRNLAFIKNLYINGSVELSNVSIQ